MLLWVFLLGAPSVTNQALLWVRGKLSRKPEVQQVTWLQAHGRIQRKGQTLD
jgi:hypothetical protein